MGAAEDPLTQSQAACIPCDTIRCKDLSFSHQLNSNIQFIVLVSCGKLLTNIGVLSSGSLMADQWLLLATVYGPIVVCLALITLFMPQFLVNRSPSFGADPYSIMLMTRYNYDGSPQLQRLKLIRNVRMPRKRRITTCSQRLRSSGKSPMQLSRPDLCRSGLLPSRPRKWKS